MLLTVVRLLLLAEDNFESSPQFSHGHVVLKAELVKFCSGMLPLQSGKSLSFLLEFMPSFVASFASNSCN